MLGIHELEHLLSMLEADCVLNSAAVMSTKPMVVPALDMIISAALLAGTCLTLNPAVCRRSAVSHTVQVLTYDGSYGWMHGRDLPHILLLQPAFSLALALQRRGMCSCRRVSDAVAHVVILGRRR